MRITARIPQRPKSGRNTAEHQKTQTDNTQNKLECDISTREGILMITCWSMCLAYIGYCIYSDSDTIVSTTDEPCFLPGWKFTERLKDFSNFEWEFWRDFWTNHVWPVVLGHVLVNMLLSASPNQVKLVVNITYSIIAVWWLVHSKILMFILAFITSGYLVALSGNVAIIWSSALLVLFVGTFEMTRDWMTSFSNDDAIYPRRASLMMFGVINISLRIISFGLDWREHRRSTSNAQVEDKNKKCHRTEEMKYSHGRGIKKEVEETSVMYEYSQFLHYCMYIPLFFTGPMFNYDEFQKQFWNPKKQWTKESLKNFIIFGLRVAFSFFLCELMLHYMYFNAINHNMETMKSVSLWTLAGIGFYHGQFFMVKYVVLFGLPRFLALTDHLDAPSTPSCVGRIGNTIPIWRTFDRGLYLFMTKYIYIPIGGGHRGVLTKMLGSALCFSFVFLWHGAILAVFIWVFVNFVDITFEAMADSINKLPAVQNVQTMYFSEAATRRLKSLIRAISKLFTIIAVNFFCSSSEKVGMIYVQRLVFEGFPTSFFLCVFFLFCMGQSDHFITALEKRRSRKNCLKSKDL